MFAANQPPPTKNPPPFSPFSPPPLTLGPFRRGYTTRRCGEAGPAREAGERRKIPACGRVENGLPPARRAMRGKRRWTGAPPSHARLRAGSPCVARQGGKGPRAVGRPAWIFVQAPDPGIISRVPDKRRCGKDTGDPALSPPQRDPSHAQKPPNGTLEGAVFHLLSMGSFKRPVRLNCSGSPRADCARH